MLHILLLLLKVVGIILFTVLGIVLLLLLLLVFTPLRYEIEGSGKGDLSSLHMRARISFFVRLIRVSIEYQEEQFAWKVSLAWKHFSNEKTTVETEKKVEKSEPKISSSSDLKKHEVQNISTDSVTKQKSIDGKSENKTTVEKIEAKEKNEKSEEKEVLDHLKEEKEKRDDTKKPKDAFFKRIERWAEKLKCTSRKIYAMMITLKEKTEEVRCFIKDETHQNAFFKLLSELKRFLKKAKPKTINGSIQFGFEDPSVTGRVLGGISMVYPYIQEDLELSADFEKKTLSGNFYIKGRIRLSMILSFVAHMLFSKAVRITIQHSLKLSKKLKQGGK